MTWVRIDDAFEDHPKVEPLSDAAHRLWLRAACWCRKPTNEHTLGFVPRAMLRTIAKNSASQKKLEKFAQELVDARGGGVFEHGLWEEVEGGWIFHDWATYQPKDDEERIIEKRREAGRKGAEARWGKDANPDGKRNGTACGTAPSTADGTASFANGKPMAKNAPEPAPDPGPDQQDTSQPVSRPDPLKRPVVRAGLLDPKISARDWIVPDDHREYALASGLSPQQFDDTVADFREKTRRTAEPPWLSSVLCRFIDARAQRIAEKKPSGVVPIAPLYTDPTGEAPDIRALREAGLQP